jgi:hypothetical protein
MLARVDRDQRVVLEVLPHALMKITQCLKRMRALHAMRLRVTMTMPTHDDVEDRTDATVGEQAAGSIIDAIEVS